jgi:serine protease Do
MKGEKKPSFFYLIFFLAFYFVACIRLEAEEVLPKSKTEFGAKKAPEIFISQSAQDFRYAVADMTEKVMPVIVSIRTETLVQNQMSPFGGSFLEEFFFGPGMRRPHNQEREPQRQQGLGSGVIVSESGFILTNNHVIEKADKIIVTLSDDSEYEAEIVGRDEQTDLAVLKLKGDFSDLPVAYLGDSDKLRVGEWIVAIGSPYGLSKTVTTGIVSAKGVHNRGITSYENFIQTDAAINPGNSGGAMLNLNGELVGINTAILSRSGGFQGIGFAIPINLAKTVMQDLIDEGKVTRGWIGVSIQNLDKALAEAMKLKSTDGALISEVFSDSPAEKGGLKAGDVVISVGGRKVKNVNDLRNNVALIRPGSKTDIEVIRDGKKQVLKIEIGNKETGTLALSPQGSADISLLGISAKNPTDKDILEHKLGEGQQGVLISEIKKDSPADKSGLKTGDLIQGVNRNTVHNLADLSAILKKVEGDSKLYLLIRRQSSRQFVALTIK